MFDVCGNMNHVTISSGGWGFACSGGILNSVTLYDGGRIDIESGGKVNDLVVSGGYVDIEWGSTVSNITVDFAEQQKPDEDASLFDNGIGLGADAKLTGRITILNGGISADGFGAILDFDLTQTSAGDAALVNDLSKIEGMLIYTLTVNGTQTDGEYILADGASGFNSGITVVNTDGAELGMLTIGETKNIGGADYSLNLTDDVLSVTVGASVLTSAKSDIDGNGVSDVMFVWTGEHGEGNHAHGYWMNGSDTWWSANAPGVSPDWDNLGSYDMSGDGKADAVMIGNVEVNGVKGAYVGYYQDGDDANGWVNIGYLNNAENIAWQNKVGNLTGNASGANSIVWYAPDLYALGVWTDGTDNWVSLSGFFGGDQWTLVGCGDFSGTGKDTVLMSLSGGAQYYTVDIDSSVRKLGNANWASWEVRAIGDFAGDGKDDIVLFHEETGAMVMCSNGNIDSYVSIGQLAADDWFVVGAGDYNGDQKDDLLVRQYTTGMLGYYTSGDTTQWNVLGYGVGMEWTVIA